MTRPLKILVDETSDGLDIKLQNAGYKRERYLYNFFWKGCGKNVTPNLLKEVWNQILFTLFFMIYNLKIVSCLSDWDLSVN